jgi:hypothetical protein
MNDRHEDPRAALPEPDSWEESDDAADIRYSLTALGEAVLAGEPRRTRGTRFRGVGPCTAVA